MQVETCDFTRHLMNFFFLTHFLSHHHWSWGPPHAELRQLTTLLRPRARPGPIERHPWLKTRVYVLWEQFRYCLQKPTHSSPWSFMPSLTPAGHGLLELAMSLPHREVTGIKQYLEGFLEGSCRKPGASLMGWLQQNSSSPAGGAAWAGSLTARPEQPMEALIWGYTKESRAWINTSNEACAITRADAKRNSRTFPYGFLSYSG